MHLDAGSVMRGHLSLPKSSRGLLLVGFEEQQLDSVFCRKRGAATPFAYCRRSRTLGERQKTHRSHDDDCPQIPIRLESRRGAGANWRLCSVACGHRSRPSGPSPSITVYFRRLLPSSGSTVPHCKLIKSLRPQGAGGSGRF
jgi:hypothetical protein